MRQQMGKEDQNVGTKMFPEEAGYRGAGGKIKY